MNQLQQKQTERTSEQSVSLKFLPKEASITSLRQKLPLGNSYKSDYRSWVEWASDWDTSSTIVFNLLSSLGLREHHTFLDIGCGSLRVGRLLIPYLLPEKYFGIEREQWVLEEGIHHEVGNDLVEMKKPRFSIDETFELSSFGYQFNFILCNLVFVHQPKKNISKCLSEAKNVLKPNGFFIANFEIGKKNYLGEEISYPEMIPYTMEFIRSIASKHDLVCTEIDWNSLSPTIQWVIFTHPGGEKNLPSFDDRLISQHEIEYIKAKFLRYANHPYVKFGVKVRYFLQRLGIKIS